MRRIRRVTTLVVLTWLGLLAAAVYAFLAFPESLVLGFSPDDAAAMAWLSQNAAQNELVVNDYFADAGIWAPFKAGRGVVYPRLVAPEEAAARALVVDHVGELDQNPSAAAAACALNARYVFYGARVSGWDIRRFPSLAELKASPALEAVFSQGDAVVFRINLNC